MLYDALSEHALNSISYHVCLNFTGSVFCRFSTFENTAFKFEVAGY